MRQRNITIQVGEVVLANKHRGITASPKPYMGNLKTDKMPKERLTCQRLKRVLPFASQFKREGVTRRGRSIVVGSLKYSFTQHGLCPTLADYMESQAHTLSPIKKI